MAEEITGHPPRPPSEVEWEELLVRVELMARAFRNAVEELDLAAAEGELRELVAREARVSAWLEARALAAAPSAESEADSRAFPVEQLADRFVSLRARNFAMVQRRGLGVWEWRGDFGEAGAVSAYQLFRWLVAADVASLAALRAAGKVEARAC